LLGAAQELDYDTVELKYMQPVRSMRE